jgi:hypothetical protein
MGEEEEFVRVGGSEREDEECASVRWGLGRGSR